MWYVHALENEKDQTESVGTESKWLEATLFNMCFKNISQKK